MTQNQHEDTKPWYKQFWPWFLIALPGSVVIAGIATIIIATKNSDSLVKANYYKEGLAINESIGRQKKAAELGLSFTLEVKDKQVVLTSSQPVDYPIIYLFMQHPVHESKDFTLALSRSSDTQFIAKDVMLGAFNYRVRLYPPDNQWEILERWHPEKSPTSSIEAQ